MKTFDEAFALVSKSQTLGQDLHSFGSDGLSNPMFVRMIQELVMEWTRRLPTLPDDKCMDYSCAFLQSVFNVGLKIGIEMEKQ